MKFQSILLVAVAVLFLLPSHDAKRSFGLTRSRSKNKGPSVRRNQQHDFDDGPLPPVHPKPSMPELRKPVNYSPLGPPPGYPGMGSYQSSAPHGAPPAYSPSHGSPPGYHTKFGQQPSHHSSYGSGMPMGAMPMGGPMPMGAMPMGGPMPMGVMPIGSPNNYGRSSGMGSGIMTNLFAGLAGYQLAKAFSGGHRDREVFIIDNRQPINANPSHNYNLAVAPVAPSEILPNFESEEPQTKESTYVGPADNEYNFYGVPQYGTPLYGFSLPTQITDYYQTAVIPKRQEFHEPPSSYQYPDNLQRYGS